MVDARSDNFDGRYLAGWIDKSVFYGVTQAIIAVDQHESGLRAWAMSQCTTQNRYVMTWCAWSL